MKKFCAVMAVVALTLVAAPSAEAKLTIFQAERAATRYIKSHCNANYCTIASCRRLSRNKIDCSAEVWDAYPVNETCFYTVHVSKYGKYSRPSVWIGGLEYCE